jgi:hypothetical protein
LPLAKKYLEKSGIGLGNHGENTFCVQENVEKRGVLGGMGVELRERGPQSAKESLCKTRRFEGLFGFGGGIVPLGGLGAIYGDFCGLYGEGTRACSCGGGFLPQGGPVSKIFGKIFSGNNSMK